MDARTNELPLESEHEYSEGPDYSQRSSARPSIGATDILETLRRSWRLPLYGFLIGLALAALSPVAILLPFIDPGLAKDANCAGLVAQGKAQGAPVRAQAAPRAAAPLTAHR